MLCLDKADTLNIRMKEFASEKMIFDKMTAMNLDNFPLYGFCICMVSAFKG